MGWLTVTVPRSTIENGLSLVVETSTSVFELVGVGQFLGDSMTILEEEHLGQLRCILGF